MINSDISPSYKLPQRVGERQAAENSPSQVKNIDDTQRAKSSAETRAQQFENHLNQQQKITHLSASQQGQAYDPVDDVAQGFTSQQSGQLNLV